jgi:hypothetical protein
VTRAFGTDAAKTGLARWAGNTLDPNAGAGLAGELGSTYVRDGQFPTIPTETYRNMTGGVKGWIKQNLVNLRIFNVTKAPYNCVGDGATNCGPGIRQAITDANAAGGGIIYFPAASSFYSVPFNSISATSCLPLNNVANILFMGDGWASEIRANGDFQARFQCLFLANNQSRRLGWYNIRLSMTGVTNSDVARTSSTLQFSSEVPDVGPPGDFDVEQVWFDPSWADGIRTVGPVAVGAADVTDIRVNHCMFNMQGTGGAASMSRDCISANRNVSRVLIYDNWFAPSGTVLNGQQIDFEPGGGDPPQDWWMVGNIFNSINAIAVTLSGNDATHGSLRLNFSYNICRGEDVGSAGATLEAVNRPTECVIHGNIIVLGPSTTTGFAPIELRIAQNCIISDNLCISNAAAATRGAINIFEDGGQGPVGNLLVGNLCKAVATNPNNISVISNSASQQCCVHGNLAFADCGTAVGCSGIQFRSTSFQNVDSIANGNLVMATSAQNFIVGIDFTTAPPGFAFHNCQCSNNMIVGATNAIRFDSSGAAFLENRVASGNNCLAVTNASISGPASNVGVTVDGSGTPTVGCGIDTLALAAGPASVVSAPPGFLCSNTAGGQATVLFYKESGAGNTGWFGVGAFEYTFGGQAGSTATAARFFAPGMALAAEGTVEIKVQCVRPGTLRNLRLKCVAGTGGGNNTYRVRKNGADTNLLVTIANTATAGSNTGNTVAMVAGDTISFQVTKTAAPTGVQSFITGTFEMA